MPSMMQVDGGETHLAGSPSFPALWSMQLCLSFYCPVTVSKRPGWRGGWRGGKLGGGGGGEKGKL